MESTEMSADIAWAKKPSVLLYGTYPRLIYFSQTMSPYKRQLGNLDAEVNGGFCATSIQDP